MAQKPVLMNFRRATTALSTLNRSTATAAAVDLDPEWTTARPYSEIPGPKPLPIPKFGNFWRMLPRIGRYGGLSMYEFHDKLYKDFGPIVKLAGLGRPDMICLFDPADAEKVFRTESAWPRRPGIETIDYYRRVTRYDVFHGNPGVVTSQGEEWQKNRTAVNQPMMKPRNVMQYHKPIQIVAGEFIEKIKTLRDDNLELPEDFSNELSKWALESISLVALDARLGCLEGSLKPDSDAQILIDSVDQMFKMFYKLDIMPSLWKYVSTPNWRKLVKALDQITNIGMKHVNKKLAELEARPAGEAHGMSVLETLLRMESGRAVAMTMAMDTMMAGIDTTSNSTAIAIYYLAKNPEAQEKVFEEMKKVLPGPEDDLPENYLNSIPYLKACVKESQRLSPLALANARTTGKDIVLKGYQIPKGIDCSMANMVMCHMEQNFSRPEEFIPERWLKSESGSPQSSKNTNPFVFMPFGFGPRMCIGRRLAELEMHTLLAKIFRNFEVSYNYGEMEWQTEILLSPKSPLKFCMKSRST